ncbi:MAG: T9SS type A sorting domain-containing protein [Chitinophagaceae bacterium]|nr:T9SS type A sorting domain-containing protein [Chitinophagaceae bacterium]
MRNIFTLLMTCLLVGGAFAQIQPVSYRGAFAPAPTPMWTDGWAEWNPQNRVYPATTVTVNSADTIKGNVTWTSNNVYLLRGVVYVDSLATLTIQPGTIIRGDDATANSSLLVRRGGKLIAVGSPCAPIVFTSNKAAGNRAPGDWGGIILLGRASLNTPGGVANIEGLPAINQHFYGGGNTPDDNDNSGALSYVRIEFGGYVFEQNREINGLTLGAIGRATQIDHIQCSFINDDSFEWFGGTANASHLVAFRGVDDNWDTDFGFSGAVQFCLGVRDPDLWDPTFTLPSGGSTSEGFESDNDAGGSTNTPKTRAIFSNVTEIGPNRGTPVTADIAGFRRGARIRRNSELKILNSIIMDWRTGLFIDGSAAENNAINGLLVFRHNIIAGAQNNRAFLRSANTASYAGISNIDSVASTAGILISPYNFFTPDYRPATGSIALTGANFNDPVLPIVLSKFEGRASDEGHLLWWETQSEQNNRGFELQRSANGNSFSTISFIPANTSNGNSTTRQRYNYLDRAPLDGISYYRLRQVDRDGRSSFSPTILLRTGRSSRLSISMLYPNPALQQTGLSVVSPVADVLKLTVYDANGRAVLQETRRIAQGSTNLSLDLQRLGKGTYRLVIQSDAQGISNQQSIIKL